MDTTLLHSPGYTLKSPVALSSPQRCFSRSLLPAPSPARRELLPMDRFLAAGQGRSLGPRGPEPGRALPTDPAPRPAPGPATSTPPAGPGGRSQVFAGARMSELWLRSGSGSLRSLRAGLPAHPESRGAPAALPAAWPPSSQPPGLGGPPPSRVADPTALPLPPAALGPLQPQRAPTPLPASAVLQFCPGRAAALERTPFLPSFILSGNSHSSSACDVPRTRPLDLLSVAPGPRGPPGSLCPPPQFPSLPRLSLSSLMSCFTPSLAFNCSLIIFPVKGQSVAGSGGRFVTKIRV